MVDLGKVVGSREEVVGVAGWFEVSLQVSLFAKVEHLVYNVS